MHRTRNPAAPAQESPVLNRRVLAFGAVYLLWGGAYLAIHFVIQVIPPFLAAGIRYSLSAIVLLTISFLMIRDALPSRRQLLNCVVTGLMMFTFGYSAIYWAETRLPSWMVSVLASTGFLWTYLAECVFLHTDRLRARTVFSLVGGIVGMALLAGFPFEHRQSRSILAALAVLASTISWAIMTVILKRVELPRSFVQTAGLQLGAAGFALIPLACFLGEARQLPASSEIFKAGPILGMTYLVLGGSVIAFSAFHWLLARETPSLVATTTYVNPIIATLVGIVLDHERYTPTQLGGAAAVLFSVILVWRAKTASRDDEPLMSNAASSVGAAGGAALD